MGCWILESERMRWQHERGVLKAMKIWASVFFLGLITLYALGAPLLGMEASFIDVAYPTAPPLTAGHWFGTDDLGRDLFVRIAAGARISLTIGLVTAIVAVVIGTLYGVLAAQLGGLWDVLMMRIIDVIYSLPGLMVVILLSLFLGRGVFALVLALALFSWPDTARIIRGQVLALKQEEFVTAYHSLGGRLAGLLFSHFLPNLTGLIVLTATITVPRAILTESTLSFIGLGVEPPLSSWGTLASEGWQLIRVAPHLLILPTFFIFTTMVALNLLGDGLRAWADPRDRSRT